MEYTAGVTIVPVYPAFLWNTNVDNTVNNVTSIIEASWNRGVYYQYFYIGPSYSASFSEPYYLNFEPVVS